MSLCEKLQKYGFKSTHLDEIVHDAASRIASRINNEGMKEQLEFLNEQGFIDRDILQELRSIRGIKISAECHSDDRVHEVWFDAEPWFRKATVNEIYALAKCGWANDFAADEVARFMAKDSEDISRMFQYLGSIAHLRSKKDASGFECSVDMNDALNWLVTYRKDVVNLDMAITLGILDSIIDWVKKTSNVDFKTEPVERQNVWIHRYIRSSVLP